MIPSVGFLGCFLFWGFVLLLFGFVSGCGERVIFLLFGVLGGFLLAIFVVVFLN